MKPQIKEEINKLYSLFVKPPKLDVTSIKQHLETFADKPEHYKPNYPVTALKAAVNSIIRTGRCSWCGDSKAKVQDGFKNELSKEEYQLSALCQECQDETFQENGS